MASSAAKKAKKSYNKTKSKINKDYKATASDLKIIRNRSQNRVKKVAKQDLAAYKKTIDDVAKLDALNRAAITSGNEMSRQNILNQQNELGILGSGVGTFDEDALLAQNIASIQAKNNQSNLSSARSGAANVFKMNNDALGRNYNTFYKQARLARKDTLEQAKDKYNEQMEYIREQAAAQAAARRRYSYGGGYSRGYSRGYSGGYGGGYSRGGGGVSAGSVSAQGVRNVNAAAKRENQRKLNTKKTSNYVLNKVFGMLPGGSKFR